MSPPAVPSRLTCLEPAAPRCHPAWVASSLMALPCSATVPLWLSCLFTHGTPLQCHGATSSELPLHSWHSLQCHVPPRLSWLFTHGTPVQCHGATPPELPLPCSATGSPRLSCLFTHGTPCSPTVPSRLSRLFPQVTPLQCHNATPSELPLHSSYSWHSPHGPRVPGSVTARQWWSVGVPPVGTALPSHESVQCLDQNASHLFSHQWRKIINCM